MPKGIYKRTKIHCENIKNSSYHRKLKLGGKYAPNYKDGRKTKKYFCKNIGCNNQISYPNHLHGQGRCKWCAFKGIKNGNWKDGLSSIAILIRSMIKYKQWRNQIFKRDNYTCQNCKQHGGDLNAHHIKSFAELLSEFLKEYDQFSPIEDKETLLRLATKWQPFWNIDNGQTLCEDCHKNIKEKIIGGITCQI